MSYYSEVHADAPSLHLRLNDSLTATALDSSGNGLNGSYVNNDGTSDVSGALHGDADHACHFNGTQYITIPDNPLLDPGDVLTLEGWILPVSFADYHVIFAKDTNGYEFYLAATTGLISLDKYDVSTIARSTVAPPLGVWSHVAVTKSGSSVHIYLNGVDVTGTVTNATIAATSSALRIGTNFIPSQYWMGSLDELALYPAALSASRILAHYAAGRPQVFPLVPSWPQTQALEIDNYVADFGDGFEQRANFNQAYSHADGEGGVSIYKGRNRFTLKFSLLDYASTATTLWAFYKARSGNLESFYFYNCPDEAASIDLTGVATAGRYLVRFQDANLSRDKFTLKLYTLGLSLVEVRN